MVMYLEGIPQKKQGAWVSLTLDVIDAPEFRYTAQFFP
jgi:hypothetical protein